MSRKTDSQNALAEAPRPLNIKRQRITPRVVIEIERLLVQLIPYDRIAARLDVTEYLVRTIADDPEREEGEPALPPETKPLSSGPYGLEAADIRRIQRMLRVGILTQPEIAREAGVSRTLVAQVAAGRRVAVGTVRPLIRRKFGERFLKIPERCPRCGAMICVVPCRACRAQNNRNHRKIFFTT